MPRYGYVSVTFKEESYNRLRELYRRDDHRLSFPEWITYTITEYLEQAVGILQFLTIVGDEVYLKNRTTDRIVVLLIKDKELWCTECKRNDCLHVGFCLANKQVVRRMLEGQEQILEKV
jgi:hypothetical protein